MSAFWNRAQGFVFGGAIAAAMRDAIAPVLEPVRQRAWSQNRNRVLDPAAAARLVAQALLPLSEAQDEAGRNGYDAARVVAMVALSQTAPGVAEALALYRREEITKPQLEHAFGKAQLEPEYWAPLEALANVLLDPPVVANAVQQGHLPNPGILPDPDLSSPLPPGYVRPVAVDGAPPSKVPLTQIDLDPVEQAAGHGTSFPQLQVLANLAGLPPGAMELLDMLNRGIIDEETAIAGIREGHIKTKWAGPLLRRRWAILSAAEAASARLRTWIDAEESYAIGAQTGHTKEQMDLMFLNRGRPASPTQMWRGWARKAKGPRGVPVEYEDHAKAIAISDIRPEYAEMLWEIRYNYPPLFQLGRLVTAGAIDADTAAQWAEWNLYAPPVVEALRKAWAHPNAAATKTATKVEAADEFAGGYSTEAEYRQVLAHLGYTGEEQDMEVHLADAQRIKRAREAVVTAIGKAYLAHAIDDTTATSQLAEVNVLGQAAQLLLRMWGIERQVTIRELSDAQVVKAYGKNIIPEADALERLRELGFSDADAQIRLQEG